MYGLRVRWRASFGEKSPLRLSGEIPADLHRRGIRFAAHSMERTDPERSFVNAVHLRKPGGLSSEKIARAGEFRRRNKMRSQRKAIKSNTGIERDTQEKIKGKVLQQRHRACGGERREAEGRVLRVLFALCSPSHLGRGLFNVCICTYCRVPLSSR